MTYDGPSARSRKGSARPILIPVLLLIAVAVLIVLAPHLSTLFWWQLRASLFWTVPILAVIVLGLVGIVGEKALAIVAAVIVLLASIGWWISHNYSIDKAYSASITVTNNDLPEYGQRAPYTVASAQVRPNLGDAPGDVADTTYILGEDYTSLVTRRGTFTGYQTLLTQTIPLTGRGSAVTCDFDAAADARAGGWFSHKLERQLNKAQRNVRFKDGDLYGYCDTETKTPIVVMPLLKQTGIFRVLTVPAGVAMYNGKTGAITFADSAPIGPSYPLSVAARQREATHALGGFSDWFFKRAGFDTTSKDSEDTNAANATELTLPGADSIKDSGYVTPLTGRGSATAVSAISEVSTNGRKGLAPLTVHKLSPAWQSTDSITKRITGDYQDLPNWSTLRIFEITPIDGKRWVASIGNDQNVLYRVTGTGNLTDSKEGANDATCLYRANGDLYRCGVQGSGTTPENSGAGVDVPTGDLSALSNEDFAALVREVGEESARRLTAISPSQP